VNDRTDKEIAKAGAQAAVETLSETLDHRNELAVRRTLLAAERTYAAWLRTALAALVTGVGSRAFLENVVPDWLASLAGTVLVLLAGFCLIAAVWPGLEDQVPPVGPDRKRIPHRLLVAVNAVLLVLTFAVLVGLWAA